MLTGVRINKKECVSQNIQNLVSITDNDEVTTMSWGDDEEREVLIGCGVKNIRRLYIISNLSAAMNFNLSFVTKESCTLFILQRESL